jgi:hypothetical protein
MAANQRESTRIENRVLIGVHLRAFAADYAFSAAC